MNNPHTSKTGAALVIALGFLAILTIMILMFAAQTRTERLSGRAYLSTAQTRHLLHTALARAMEDVDNMAGTNYPSFPALGSQSAETNIASTIDFSMEEDYFPAGNMPISNAYLAALGGARWQSVLDTGSDAIGRVGYIIINTSGLLDANRVGGYEINTTVEALERGSGLSPAELQLSPELLGEFSTNQAPLLLPDGTTDMMSGAELAFAYNRNNSWQRFETLRDVRVLNQRGGTVLDSRPESFCTFSLFPSDTIPEMDLSGTVDPATFKNLLITSCDLEPEEADAVYENYLDYIDPDNTPRNLEGSSPEAVPMINEIWMENFSFTQDAQDATNISYKISGDVYVEAWYPFEGAPPPATIQFFAADPSATSSNRVEVLAGEANIGASDYVTIDATYSNGIVKSFVLELNEAVVELDSTQKFATAKREFSYDDMVTLTDPFDGKKAPLPGSIFVKQEAVEVVEGLDRVENTELEFSYDGGGLLENQYASCIDPRINHDFSGPAWSNNVPNTPNTPNDIDEWGEESDLTDKNSIRFHVHNAPMENAAELGYLSTGKPWQTVRLYGQDLHPVLDHFQAGEDLWDTPVRPGLVNQNSTHTNVLATAFLDAPIRIDPENSAPGNRVSVAQARRMAGNLASLTAGNPQRNVSFIGNAVSNNIPDWAELNDAQKESIVANSYRLFGWRNSLFTILLVAQGGADIDDDGVISDDEVRSTQKAVVYAWRDPLTGKAACVFYGLSDTLQSTIGSGESWGDILQAFEP
ncbi:MAG: hypothetical protein U9P12_00560 [Verrucomicrobiota bacterium]|nr:hypothetical protein [Verrucomicrobiota bacterium]